MQELTDDQLDGLFRKSAEEFDPPFEPAAWRAMQARLDEHDRTVAGPPQWRNRLIRWGLPLLILALLTASSWYYVSKRSASERTDSSQRVANRDVNTVGQSAQPTPVKTTSPASEQSVETSTTATEAPQPSVLTKQADELVTASRPETSSRSNDNRSRQPDRVTSTAPETEVSVTKKTLSTPKSASADMPVPTLTATGARLESRPKRQRRFVRAKQSILVNREAGNLKSVVKPKSETSLIRTSAITANPDWAPPAAEPVGGGSQGISGTSTPASTLSVPQFTVAELRSRAGQWPRLTAVINRPVLARPDTTAQQTFVSKPATERGVSVRFVVSPDLSAVGLKNFARPGTNVGLMLEYRLARRWSFQAGALWSTKVYRTDQVPDYTLTWRVIPEGVSGQCSLLDIPINIRYDFHLGTAPNGQVRSRWFISGGTTTYIMQQEDYNYEYADPTNPHIYDGRREWHGSTGRYNFSHLNLSVGFERTINRRLSWQAEPFLKVPLRGVGYYKLNLLSTGAFLSLRYKL